MTHMSNIPILTDTEESDPPKEVELFFNSVAGNGSETLMTAFTAKTLPVIPRIGEIVHLGTHGGFNVSGVRHEYVDRAGTASPLLGRITVLLRKRTAAPRKRKEALQNQIVSPASQGLVQPSDIDLEADDLYAKING